MSDFEEYTKIIKNMPISCTYCGKKHDKDKIQYIQLLGSKREHVCNKEEADIDLSPESLDKEKIIKILTKTME